MSNQSKLFKYGKVVTLFIGAFLVSCLIVGAIPGTTSVWKYVDTGGNCVRDDGQAVRFIRENYPDWEYERCGGGYYDGETWPAIMTRRVSFLQMAYWKLTEYVSDD